MSETLTPEQEREIIEQAQKNEGLLLKVIQSPAMADRISAARELKLMPPANVQPPQTRVVIRMVRTAEGKWWGGIEGADGVVSQIVLDDVEQMLSVLGAGAALACNPLMTDDEHAAHLANLEKRTDG